MEKLKFKSIAALSLCDMLSISQLAWMISIMLILGGVVTPTYNEIRGSSLAYSHADINPAVTFGSDNFLAVGK